MSLVSAGGQISRTEFYFAVQFGAIWGTIGGMLLAIFVLVRPGLKNFGVVVAAWSLLCVFAIGVAMASFWSANASVKQNAPM